MSYPPPAYFCIIWHQFLNKFRNLLWFTITPFTTIYGLILLFWIQDWLNVRLGKCKISVCLRWHHLEILGITEFDSEMLENFSNIDLRLKLNRMHVRFYARNNIPNQKEDHLVFGFTRQLQKVRLSQNEGSLQCGRFEAVNHRRWWGWVWIASKQAGVGWRCNWLIVAESRIGVHNDLRVNLTSNRRHYIADQLVWPLLPWLLLNIHSMKLNSGFCQNQSFSHLLWA